MKKYHKVITLLREERTDWVLKGWYDLQKALDEGYVIERTDSFSGGGGWKPSGGGIVYILSKDYSN